MLPPHEAGPAGAIWLCIAIPAGIVVAARHARRQRLGQPPRSPVMGTPQRVRQPIPPAVRAAVWVKCGGRCTRCRISDEDCMGMTGQHLQYDHIVPWSRGGPDTEDNLQLLCRDCNVRKGARMG